jgi:ABC transporter substrate binding protein (PQQ-dependent alcohol dehydrogenase system)
MARLAAAWVLAMVLAGAAARADGTVGIVWLQRASGRTYPSTMLDKPPADAGMAGARLAIADNRTTGRFLSQDYDQTEIAASDDDGFVARFAEALKSGRRLFAVDAPAALLLRVADLPGAADALILDATSPDDALRGAECRANMLHMLPSRAMLADALMQYLVTKNWRRIMLLYGRTPQDALYADAVRHAAAKFQIRLKADRAWSFNPAAQQADTGHYQVNDEVAKATRGVEYDILVVADEEDNFGDELSYRTDEPRPVAGTQGLVPAAWAKPMDEYASTQLQARFLKANGRWMTPRDYGGWLAVRAFGEAATRTGSTDPAAIIAYLRSPQFTLSGYKGPELSFRPWDGQLRQPVLLADANSLVSISPQPGFLHQSNDLDTLGPDQPETQCHMH